MVIFPNAKINLGLNVVEKRSDGFHNLETCFIPIPYYDILEIIPSKKDTLTVYNFDSEKENILTKTRDKLRSIKSFDPVDIYLYKNIPASAGLGGGSSDAAFLLKALNKLFNLNFEDSELIEISGDIGKDCPFFIANKACLATGTGDIFEPVDINVSELYLMVITPPISISTKEAFSWVTPKSPEISLGQLIKGGSIKECANRISNDFLPEVESRFPEIKEIEELLISSGAIMTSLSGTGSSVYAFFENPPQGMSFPSDYKTWIGKL